MTGYTAPLQEMDFLLHEVMAVSRLDIAGYDALDPSFTDAVLTEAGKLARDVLAPLNAVGDQQGCRLENGVLRTPDGFAAAFEAMKAGGWTALDCAPEYGGQGLPYLVYTAVGELFASANMAFHMYQGLTHGAYSAILHHGSEAQKALYLPKLASCAWTGTMNLTESHAGTDLGLLRTKAEPQADGSYHITGEKIFISAGDHDLAENVIHLVLAKAPGGGEGSKGISLFIVPKILPEADGSLGAPNHVSVGKVEHKMGIHGNATCVMNYDAAKGWLLGDLHKGMRAMFTMMNEARLGVGLQGYAQAEAAYQKARAYALERRQGRAIGSEGAAADGPDLLIRHPDVRRMLLAQKSFVEGARALTYWGASLIDRATRNHDAQALALVGLLTPVIKAFQTDKGFASTVLAQQVFGGHGYIEEQGMSQFARDARIAMIYEGANGVQALDLVGRKLPAEGGATLMGFLALVRAECDAAEALPDFRDALLAALADLEQASSYFMREAEGHPNAVFAGADDYLNLMGYVAMGLMWLRMAKAAELALSTGGADPAYYTAKLETARYYMARELPATALHLARIKSGADPVMALSAQAF